MLKPSRIYRLICMELQVKGKLLAVLFISILTLSFLDYFFQLNLLNIFNNPLAPNGSFGNDIRYKYHFDWFPGFLYLLGLSITSLAFHEYRKGISRNYHLTIPANIEEKWTAKFILYAIIFTVSIILVYQLYASFINRMALNNGIILVKMGLADPYLWNLIKSYLVIHSIFFLGAAFLQRYTYLKIAAITVTMFYSTIWLVEFTLKLILNNAPEPEGSNRISNFSSSENYASILAEKGWQLTEIEGSISSTIQHYNTSSYLGLLVILFCLGLSFLRFKEMES